MSCRKILVIIVAVLATVILIPIIHHYRLSAAVNTYIAELKARGEPMELAQMIPSPVPPEQNSASNFLKAASPLDANWTVLDSNPPPAMRMVVPGKAMTGWTQPDIRSQDGINSWEEIRNVLKQNREALNLLCQITNNSAFDFNLQYTQRFEMRLTHLALEKRAAQRLAASAIYDLHLGDTGSAVKKVHAMLVLVGATREERTAISQLVRIAITQIALATTWGLLQSPSLADKPLADLQVDWSRLEFIQAAEQVLPVEREGGETDFAKWRSSNSELQRYFNLEKKARASMGFPDEDLTIWSKTRMNTQVLMWRYWWSYSDELRSLKGYDVLMNTLRLASTNGSFQTALSSQDSALDELGISKLNNSFDALFSDKTDFHSILSESIVTLAGVARKVMRVEVAKQMVVTAIALKRYQLQQGNYPADLQSLVPKFVSALPHDPVDGQSLRYRLNFDGTFLLYSVGENGKDDGGNPSPEKGVESPSFQWQDRHALDWVWPQPATPKEIQAYYAKQAKN